MPRARIVSWGSKKILAIKHVRQLSGYGLKEAKETVERGTWFDYGGTLRDQEVISELRRAGCELELDVEGGGAARGGADTVDALTGQMVLRYLSGPKKIRAIKLVRELDSSLGLRAAKELVERQGTVMRPLSPADAQMWARNFAAIDSVVELLPAGNMGAVDMGIGSSRPEPSSRPSSQASDPFLDAEDDYDF